MFGIGQKKRIYLDYAAATPVSKKALDVYVDASRVYANPGSGHTEALEAQRVYRDAKKRIAHVLGVKAQELVVVSGGTEGNNLALGGYIRALVRSGVDISNCEVVVSSIEHPSVHEVCEPFTKRGLTIVPVEPDARGVIRPEAVRDVLSERTVLVSVALVNSEIGTVQPLHAISKVVKAYRSDIVVHTDACQGAYQSLIPSGLGVDLLVVDSGKFYGPRGVGVLYVRHGTPMSNVLRGGSQEGGLRPGTESVALTAGFAVALEAVHADRKTEAQRLTALRDACVAEIDTVLPDAVVNGTAPHQSPHILNISIPDIDAEYVAMRLDAEGIALSTKSACLEDADAQQSHVVAALGGDAWRARNTLRLSFGRDTHTRDIARVVSALASAVAVYRRGHEQIRTYE